MSTLRQTLIDYLAVRRALGYKLERAESSSDSSWTIFTTKTPTRSPSSMPSRGRPHRPATPGGTLYG